MSGDSVWPMSDDSSDLRTADLRTADQVPVDDPDEPALAPKRRKKGNVWVEWFIVVAVAISAALLVRAFVLQQFAVEGDSMYSTLHSGDRVLVNKLSYRLHDPRRGDVVVLKTIEQVGEKDLIKRVVALPGETVEYRQCVLIVDGVVVVEPYLNPEVVFPSHCGADQSAVLVPDDPSLPYAITVRVWDEAGREYGNHEATAPPLQIAVPFGSVTLTRWAFASYS